MNLEMKIANRKFALSRRKFLHTASCVPMLAPYLRFSRPTDIRIEEISFGYEDPTVPANRTRIDRSPLGENAVFKND